MYFIPYLIFLLNYKELMLETIVTMVLYIKRRYTHNRCLNVGIGFMIYMLSLLRKNHI